MNNISPIAGRLGEAPPARPRRRGGGHLPDDCPVTALGTSDGTLWFLDVIGQVRAIPASKLSKLTIHNLFAPQHDWLLRAAENPAVRRGIEAAIDRFTREGRTVRAVQPPEGIKDWNDWRRQLAEQSQQRNVG
jgi:hypothetical protein